MHLCYIVEGVHIAGLKGVWNIKLFGERLIGDQ